MKDPLILTLDAGGSHFHFSAMKEGNEIGESIRIPAEVHDLKACINQLKEGFKKLMGKHAENPAAISFAFPGPADYRNGVIGDLPNLPAFRGGIPLGPILEQEFGIPVFIRNDGDLFCYGESKSGYLLWLNRHLEESGNPKRYHNLIGVTLGTGFGCGISIAGKLLEGDTGAAAEGWKLRNLRHPYSSIEESVSIAGLKRMYAEQIAMDPAQAPEPEAIYQIAIGEMEGVQPAAREAFLRYGAVVGEALATMITLIDGPVVIGGGISGAYPVFAGAMLDQLRSSFDHLNGSRSSRIIQTVYNTEQAYGLKQFLRDDYEEVMWKEEKVKVSYEPQKKLAVGLSKLGTEKAIMTGAYYYALDRLKSH